MKRESWPVTDESCRYCNAKRGTEHEDGCVCRHKTVVLNHGDIVKITDLATGEHLRVNQFLNLRSFYPQKRFRVFCPKWHQWRLWLWWLSAWHSNRENSPGVGVVVIGEGWKRRRVRLEELPEWLENTRTVEDDGGNLLLVKV